MQCPKCGAEHDGSREECASCGIIFARWQAREPRKTMTAAAPPSPRPRMSSTAFVLIALVLAMGLPFVLRSFYLRFRPLSIRPHIITPASPKKGQGRVQFLVEVCDPCEATQFPLQVLKGGYLSWFDPVSKHWFQETYADR